MDAGGEDQATVPDEDTCNICLDTLGKHGGPHSLNCGHQFCASCVQTWQQRSTRCPVCRADQGIIVRRSVAAPLDSSTHMPSGGAAAAVTLMLALQHMVGNPNASELAVQPVGSLASLDGYFQTQDIRTTVNMPPFTVSQASEADVTDLSRSRLPAVSASDLSHWSIARHNVVDLTTSFSTGVMPRRPQ